MRPYKSTIFLLSALVLSGCGSAIPNSSSVVTPHVVIPQRVLDDHVNIENKLIGSLAKIELAKIAAEREVALERLRLKYPQVVPEKQPQVVPEKLRYDIELLMEKLDNSVDRNGE